MDKSCLDCTGYLYPKSARCLACSAQPNMAGYIEVSDVSWEEQQKNKALLERYGL